MSQPLDLRRSMRIVRRHKMLIGIVAAVGLLGGAGYAAARPPVRTATALVVLPQSAQTAQAQAAAAAGNQADQITQYMATQVVIADSIPVLANALPHVRPPMTLQQLRTTVSVSSLTSLIMQISAKGKNAADAEATANAVADSYINYVEAPGSPVGYVPARVLAPATTATGSGLAGQMIIFGLIGLLAGGLIGVVAALAVGRRDKRLRERDDIASAIGVPVLASLPVAHPSDPAGWTLLLDSYRPAPVHAWRMRMALQQLGVVASQAEGEATGGFSLAVITMTSDPGSLALGPQLAVFAASTGIRTALVIGQELDTTVTAALRTACAAPSAKRLATLRTIGYDSADAVQTLDEDLTIVVTVVDSEGAQVPETTPTTAIVLGVSAGAATAEQLARAAVIAAGEDRAVAGILVADPLPSDRTTGRMPYLAGSGGRKQPSRMKGIATEIRR